jgi:hypothetical protein
MGYCSAELVVAFARDVPAELATPDNLARWGAILKSLPPIARDVGFECRLKSGRGAIDVGISVTPLDDSSEPLSEQLQHAPVPEVHDVCGHWNRISAFARTWEDTTSDWARRVPFLFLEFDADGPPDPIPVPSVFVALDWFVNELTREAHEHTDTEPSGVSRGHRQVRTILEVLRGRALDRATEALLTRCFDELPDYGLVLHVAAMLARPGEGIRLSTAVPRDEAPPYMQRLGWARGLSALRAAVDAYASVAGFGHPAEQIQLDFDVSDAIGDRVGLTLEPPHPTGWPPLLDALVRRGLCDPAKRDGLLRWPGLRVAQLTGGPRLVSRYLSHVKLGCGGHGEAQAKAYFGVAPQQRL